MAAKTIADALPAIPFPPSENAGMDPIDTLTVLRSKQQKGEKWTGICLLYTSDAADDSLRVDLGGRRIIKK